VRSLIDAAGPGSDRQNTLVRAFAGYLAKRIPPSTYAGAGRSAKAMEFMSGLIDGTVALDGLLVDTDLRWILLTGLAANGAVDRGRILDELDRDRTISGRERAAAALAALPTPETKAEAWASAVLDQDVANETQRSIAYVFDTVGQEDVLAEYLERYLEAAETIWEDRGVQIASTTLEYMFPRALTSRQTLDRVDAWLAGSDANPAAKKYVREARDDIARALRAQDRDA
jgi:aminopeptidase N